MAVSGFEGFEKRLELNFIGDDTSGVGLRQLDIELLEEVLHAVQCTIVSALGNRYFDSYVLSESSLFVYPTKIIIKTCGTTQLLNSVRPFVDHAYDLGLTLSGCKYTRGSYIFPNSQPHPYTSFQEEVIYLENDLPSHLRYRKASIMPSKLPSHSWHVFAASMDDDDDVADQVADDKSSYTVEVCMTELDPVLSRKFFRRPDDGKCGDTSGKDMTAITGIGKINPKAIICDFGFDPCGYSMNSVDGDRYSTIHVTPEDGYSYASFECAISRLYDNHDHLVDMLKKVALVFKPGKMSISITGAGWEVRARVKSAIEPLGLVCRSYSSDEFPAVGNVVYQTFSTRR